MPASAGNLRAAADNPGFRSLVDHWLSERYQLRYTGGLCTDVNQLLVKGRGIFVSAAACAIATSGILGARPRARSNNSTASSSDAAVPPCAVSACPAIASAL